jgi:hypothetical protein
VESVEIFKSRREAIFTLIAIPVSVLIAIVMVTLGIWGGVLNLRGDIQPEFIESVGLVLLVTTGVSMMVSAVMWARYLRSLLWTRYVLDSQGITIGTAFAETRVSWHDVEVGEYLRPFDLIRFRSKHIQGDMVIDLPRDERSSDGSLGRRPFIMRLVESKMEGRFKRRWFP